MSRTWLIVALPVAIAAAFAVVFVLAGGGDDAKAPRTIAVRDAGASFDDKVAAARDAEARGDLQVAVQAYQDAYAIAPRPELLARIADLEDKLGNKMVAAEYRRRYLASQAR